MLNPKKFSFWIITVSIITVTIVGIALAKNFKQDGSNVSIGILEESPAEAKEVEYNTEYNRVKIEFLSGIMGIESGKEFETTDLKIVEFIDSTLQSSLTPAKENDLENNHTNEYTIKLSNDIGGYSCKLYYDTLQDKAYIVKDGGTYEINTDFVCYIDELLENTEDIDNADA